MAIGSDSGIPFDIDVVGEGSGTTFLGKFRVKTRLSFREQLRIDQIRRELIGPDPAGNVGDDAAAYAVALSELAVRLVEVPGWWKESKNGLDLEDENVLFDVWKKVREIVKEEAAKRSGAAKSAEDELREVRAEEQTAATTAAAQAGKVPAKRK